jgi:hypothetical protein
MIRNPNPRPDGSIPPVDVNTPELNPEIAEYFRARQRRLNVVQTTRAPSGQTLDWIPIESQVPTGAIASAPPPHAVHVDDKTTQVRLELNDEHVEHGPIGTVPVPRKNLAALHEITTLSQYLSKQRPLDPDNTFFHATSAQAIACLGCETWLNVWQPYVEYSNDHSLMQLALQNFDRPQLQSLEAGWTCDQSLNGDWNPHLFTYYTTNGYTNDGDNQGGYNSDVDGWVQVSGDIYPGILLGPTVSTTGGPQLGLAIRYLLYENNWWFWVQNNANGGGEWIGYYPSWLFFGAPGESLFSTLGASAEAVGFWGEVGTASSDPYDTTTQMGSGARADKGWQKACFQKNLCIQTTPSTLKNQNGTASADYESKFDIKLFANSKTTWDSYFYAGG